MGLHLLACASCYEGLSALGALPVPGRREGSLLDRCDVHPTRFPTHAALLLEATPELVERWRALAGPPPDLMPREDDARAALIASLAVQLMGAKGVESDAADIEVAVMIARQLLAAAKGEAIR